MSNYTDKITKKDLKTLVRLARKAELEVCVAAACYGGQSIALENSQRNLDNKLQELLKRV